MADVIMVLGASGSGKSTSLRNVPPEKVSVISATGKRLPFRTTIKPFVTDDYEKIAKAFSTASADILILDDSQYLMANEFMRRAYETGFQKFTDIGASFFNLVALFKNLPAEKTVYLFHHIEENDAGKQKAKTIGKMLDDKITLEGLFTTVLFTCTSEGRFYFQVKTNGLNTAKTPLGMFETDKIDNDLWEFDKIYRAYYDMPEPRNKTSKAEAKESAK